jgi:hypothetical protein
MWPELVEYLGNRFTHDHYLFWSRVEGTLWTAADIVIAWSLIRMGNLARAFVHVRLHRFSYAILLATLPLAAGIPFVDSGRMFFQLELAVTIPHFLIILYVCAVDARVGLRALVAALNENQSEQHAGANHEIP